jgi:hypothetical protein
LIATDGTARLVFGRRGAHVAIDDARPWRAQLAPLLSREVVFEIHLPLLAREFTARIREIAASGSEVRWYNETKRMAFSAAARAAVGSMLTDDEVDLLFQDHLTLSAGAFASVRLRGTLEAIPLPHEIK